MNTQNKTTLKGLFNQGKDSLKAELSQYSLPKDNAKVQQVITEHFSKLFDSDGDYRQNLTQSEDYILQAAISLLNAQQEMSFAFLKRPEPVETPTDVQENESTTEDNAPAEEKKVSMMDSLINPVNAMLGSGVGALVGRALGGWGAVFGAIAGTAVVVYLASKKEPLQVKHTDQTAKFQTKPISPIKKDAPIDAEAFSNVIGSICDSVDNLVETFRAQINKVVAKYENQEKPTIEKEYSFLLESIQTLIGYERTHSAEEEKYVGKIVGRIEDLAETLENYNLAVENYEAGVNEHLFELVSSPETKVPRMVYPAITKNGIVALKGKVFIPKE